MAAHLDIFMFVVLDYSGTPLEYCHIIVLNIVSNVPAFKLIVPHSDIVYYGGDFQDKYGSHVR